MTMHKEITGTIVNEYVVELFKQEQVMSNGSRRCSVMLVEDIANAAPVMATIWLKKDEHAPARKDVITAATQQSTVTNMDNGREYKNNDVTMWVKA